MTYFPILQISRIIYKDLSNFNEGYSSLAKDLNLVVKEEKPKEVKKVVKFPERKAVSSPEVIKPKITVFRSSSKELSEDDVKSMLKKYGFFDSDYNKNGKGFDNKYEAKAIKENKVIIDSTLGLMWQQNGSKDSINYENTKKYIENLNNNGFASFKNWRLPTLEEAMSLMEPERKNDRFIDSIFDRK